MSRQKEPLGSKITQDKSLENQLILWINLDNKITNYELSKRLKEQHDIKLSQPTINKWRINFFKDKQNQLQEEKSKLINTDSTDYNLKYEQIRNLYVLLEDLIDRKEIIKTTLKEKIITDKNGVDKPRIDVFTENIYKDYINSIINLEDKILKYTADVNPYTVAREVLEKILTFTLIVTEPYKLSDEDRNKLKQYIVELDSEYFVKYSLERKK